MLKQLEYLYLNSVNQNLKREHHEKRNRNFISRNCSLYRWYYCRFFIDTQKWKGNINWLKNQSGQTKNWLEHTSRKLRDDSEQRIDRLSKGIKKSLKDSVPDLYEATSELSFSEEEEIEELTKK